MTSKKAIQIVDMFLEKKTNLKTALASSQNNWESDSVSSLVLTEIVSLTNEISWLKILKKEIALSCNHPKKMRDRTPDGQWYCMNCNMDL